MNFFKRRAALTALGAAALATVAGSAMAQTVTLRLHQMLPPQATIPAKALVPWAQKDEAESGGKIKVQLFHAMQLGGATITLRQLRGGGDDCIARELSGIGVWEITWRNYIHFPAMVQ